MLQCLAKHLLVEHKAAKNKVLQNYRISSPLNARGEVRPKQS